MIILTDVSVFIDCKSNMSKMPNEGFLIVRLNLKFVTYVYNDLILVFELKQCRLQQDILFAEDKYVCNMVSLAYNGVLVQRFTNNKK